MLIELIAEIWVLKSERVLIYEGAKQTKAYKFVRAFHGRYRVMEVLEMGVVVQSIDRPQQEPM